MGSVRLRSSIVSVPSTEVPPQRELVDVNGINPGNAHPAESVRRSILGCHAHRLAELPKITADRVQLQQVFMNLMLNAIGSHEGLRRELTFKSQLQDGQLQFSVE